MHIFGAEIAIVENVMLDGVPVRAVLIKAGA
jgi:hypothetical protein